MITPAQLSLPKSDRGAALLASLCFATVLAIALGSYITVCLRSLQMSTRNLSSGHGVELAEMGMEEALWALNKSDWTNGWTIAGTTATKTLSGFSYENGVAGSVNLTVTNYNGTLVGVSRTVTATGTTTFADGTTSSRTLTATSARAPLFVNAVAAVGTASSNTVSFSSAGTVDSYNSTLGLYSAQTPTYSAIVAAAAVPATTNASATVVLTNALVKGYVASLYSGGPSVSSSGRVYGPTSPASPKVDPSRVSASPYQPIFELKTISGGTSLTAPAVNSTTTLGTAGDITPVVYRYASLDLTGTTKLIIDGPVRLVVPGNFYVGLHGGTPSIEVSSTGTLEIFTGSDIAIYGNGLNNLTQDPKRLALYGTNALTAPDMNTTVAFYGVIYTPTGTFKILSNNAIYGAIVAKQVSFTGSAPVIHYDLNLRDVVFTGIDTPFAISNWRETTAP